MSKRKRDGIKVHFIGENADKVTGSMILIEFNKRQILLECGLFQSNSLLEDYKINSRKFKFKPRQIEYVFLNHIHADHMGLIPRLYKEGCKAPIITTSASVSFIEPLLNDSAYIMSKDVASLNMKGTKEYKPIYTADNVSTALDNIIGYDMNRLYELDDEVSFMFVPSGHIIGSAQLVLYIKERSNKTTKILYTSDLGNITYEQPFVEKFEQVHKATYVIGECTYADKERVVPNKKAREKDIEKIHSVVETVCKDLKGQILIPCFSLQRTQTMLSLLYKLYGKDDSFKIPIVVDSPLACTMSDIFREVLSGENKELIENIFNWKNVRFIKNADESKLSVADTNPKIIISASGMMNSGRVRYYLKSVLPRANCHILFCGYSTEGTMAWKIKNFRSQKTLSIDGKVYANRCQVTNLLSFSGHMQHDDLIKYYSSIRCEKLFLVHGNQKDKIAFKNELQNIISEKGETTKVVAVNRGTIATL